MEALLLITGGSLYLSSKTFLFSGELSKDEMKSKESRLLSWIFCLTASMPIFFWFLNHGNYIASLIILASGFVAAIHILMTAMNWKESAKKTTIATCIIVATSLPFSLHEFQGITTQTQMIEIAMAVGFLFGTYLLGIRDVRGHLGIAVMDVSSGALFFIQGYNLMAFQQAISVCLVIGTLFVNIPRKKRGRAKLSIVREVR